MAFKPSELRKIRREDFQGPNLTPIMNLFIVIIPMLITMVVSVNLAMIEIAIPTASEVIEDSSEGPGAEASNGAETATIRLALTQEGFVLMVDEQMYTEIPLRAENQQGKRFDYLSLDKELKDLKSKYEAQNNIEILPDPAIVFDVLMRSIDVCKFRGFKDITYLTTETRIIQVN
ncbi:MAG: biopolymer transporter ExbD [Candidatus Cloacimonetes bacterium]|nr:biopolymer transporter ExbD [Candidatus Cloacimonadota bacterium]